ncbi:MAG TPA: rhomboid family intramembrane serine protease [Candidatus Blautia excrementipullorum]|nr:rhomboid family intramembrane serine protease [Candidatus Blautia excrementipullorum]
MNWIDKLERKFGRYGIHNLTLYIVICYVLGYILMYANPGLLSMMSLEPAMILRGQIWRLVTWVIYPPSTGNFLLFAISILFFYYPIGTSLERTWGTFRYNLYIFMGLLFVMAAAFLTYFITGRMYLVGSVFTTYYVSMSVFLAYAASYPDMQILLWFVIPIKMKWMAWVYGIIIVYNMVTYIRYGAWVMAVPIVASFLNFILFFLSGRNMQRYRPKEVKRRRDFQKAMAQSRVNPKTGGIAKHKCAICGRTELDDPNLEFRFCSKCNGNYEYCQDHLFTHQHVK